MKSTENIKVQQLRKGVYRITSAGARSAVTGKFVPPSASSRHPLSSFLRSNAERKVPSK